MCWFFSALKSAGKIRDQRRELCGEVLPAMKAAFRDLHEKRTHRAEVELRVERHQVDGADARRRGPLVAFGRYGVRAS